MSDFHEDYDPVEDCQLNDKYCTLPFYEFYGWDFSELCWCWNMPVFNDEQAIEQINFILNKCHYNGINRHNYFTRKAIRDIRDFVKISLYRGQEIMRQYGKD